MSPSEDDLRRALADGEGDDVPNANHVIAAAREHRGRRRRTLLSAAAAVVVVGGIAGGVAALAGGNDTNGGDSSGTAGSGGAAVTAGGNAGRSGVAGAGSAPAGMTCPSSPGHPLLPGGGGSGQFGSGGKLFDKPVSTATVCAYPDSANANSPIRVTLTGQDAATLVDSLENADRTKPHLECPLYVTANQRTIVILAQASDGTTLPAVTTAINEVPCRVQVTNGTAVRYAWTWPTSLRRQLAVLNQVSTGTPSVQGSSSAPAGIRNGSPPNK